MLVLRPPRAPVFPYTTLFRSVQPRRATLGMIMRCSGWCSGARAGGSGADGAVGVGAPTAARSEEHTSELQSRRDLVCRLLLEKKKERNRRARSRSRRTGGA